MAVETIEKTTEEEDAERALELSQEWAITQEQARQYIEAERQAPKGVKRLDGVAVLAAPVGILNSPRADTRTHPEERVDLDLFLQRYETVPAETKFREQTDPQMVMSVVETFIETQPQIVQELGISDWLNLTVPQIVLLTGAIVNFYIEYDDERFARGTAHTEVAGYGAQDFLQEGKAVCHYFALTYEQVFEAIKQRQISAGNKKIDGTTAICIRDDGISNDAKNHAYDLVFSHAADGSMDIAMIDPTWAENTPVGSHEWQENLDYATTRTGVALLTAMDLGMADGRTVGPAIHDWVAEDPANIDRLTTAIKLDVDADQRIKKGMRGRSGLLGLDANENGLRLIDEFLPQIQSKNDQFKVLLMAIDLAAKSGDKKEVGYISQAQQILPEVDMNELMSNPSQNMTIVNAIEETAGKNLYHLHHAQTLSLYQTFLKNFIELRQNQGRPDSVQRLQTIESHLVTKVNEGLAKIDTALITLIEQNGRGDKIGVAYYCDGEGKLAYENLRETVACLIRAAKTGGGDEDELDNLQTTINDRIAQIENDPAKFSDAILKGYYSVSVI